MKNRNKFKRVSALLLSFLLVLSVVIPGGADAAAKPSLTAKTKTVQVGKTVLIKTKNIKKKDKISWKINKKSIAKIASSSKKSCKIKGVRKGNAILTCTVKGKKQKKLTCKITVKNAKNINVPATTTPSANESTTPPDNTITPPNEPTATTQPTPNVVPSKWVTTWGTAEEKCDITDTAMPQMALEGTTVRQIIRVTTSGEKIKFRLTNQYGQVPVVIKSMHIAKQVTAKQSTITPSTDTIVTVGGQEEFTIPAGKVIETDGIDFSVKALENIAISTYFGEAPTTSITGHRGARATTYQVTGNAVATETLSNVKKTTSWFFLADTSIDSPANAKAVVCFGDSITDGYGTDASYLGKTPDSYTRWGDYFAKRLQANESTKNVSVINEGIGSNSILGAYPTDAGKDRFERDLTVHDGVAYCIILFGVNDLNKLTDTSKYEELLPEYEKMVKLCHDNGIKVYGAPILPFGANSSYSESSEAVRQLINNWMRSTDSQMDGIINFDKAVEDPDNPLNILPAYTNKDDGLHPFNGYEAMANCIDLTMFE